jgi:hypothetical protein
VAELSVFSRGVEATRLADVFFRDVETHFGDVSFEQLVGNSFGIKSHDDDAVWVGRFRGRDAFLLFE